MFLTLARKSLLNRKGSVVLTVLSMSISIFVLLGVEHIRHQAKDSFSRTVSGVDLIVGSRTGSLNLLLYSVFHIGSPSNNVSWKSYTDLANNTNVKWAIPLSLGDSHRGYRVLGTTPDYFQHFSYGPQKHLAFEQGRGLEKIYDVVLGYDVAHALQYTLGESLVIAHGLGQTSFQQHDDKPFSVVGVLKKTGTPVDQTVHISLQGMTSIHSPGKHPNTLIKSSILSTPSVTAILLRLNSKMATFNIQRQINTHRSEPLTAILPGVALMQLWKMMGTLENILRLIAGFILAATLLGLSAMLLTSIRERSHEIKLLRMIGASPLYVFFLIEFEALCISLLSIVLGVGSLITLTLLSADFLATNYGIYIDADIFTLNSLGLIIAILALSIASSMIPAVSAYRKANFHY